MAMGSHMRVEKVKFQKTFYETGIAFQIAAAVQVTFCVMKLVQD